MFFEFLTSLFSWNLKDCIQGLQTVSLIILSDQIKKLKISYRYGSS